MLSLGCKIGDGVVPGSKDARRRVEEQLLFHLMRVSLSACYLVLIKWISFFFYSKIPGKYGEIERQC